MKTLIITAALTLVTFFASAQTIKTVTRSFRCHDQYSNTNAAKLKTIDSLKKQGYVLQGFRVEHTVATKGYNTQVLTFTKVN